MDSTTPKNKVWATLQNTQNRPKRIVKSFAGGLQDLWISIFIHYLFLLTGVSLTYFLFYQEVGSSAGKWVIVIMVTLILVLSELVRTPYSSYLPEDEEADLGTPGEDPLDHKTSIRDAVGRHYQAEKRRRVNLSSNPEA